MLIAFLIFLSLALFLTGALVNKYLDFHIQRHSTSESPVLKALAEVQERLQKLEKEVEDSRAYVSNLSLKAGIRKITPQ